MEIPIVYSLDLNSERKNITHVEGFLTSIPEFASLQQTMYYNALIAVTEAVNNSIIHGNKLDSKKMVFVRVEIVPGESMKISVQDEGKGFNPDAVADPRDPDNILREGGRGVFLIRSLIENVEYTRLETGMLCEMHLPLQ